MVDTKFGKDAEDRIRTWLDRPELGYCIDRTHDQMSGFYGSKNVSDFTLFKKPNFYYIESKATTHDRFEFNQLTDYQRDEMYKRSKVDGVSGKVIVLFVSYQRAFILDIVDIVESGLKSINIKKLDKWTIPAVEIKTIPSRKKLLDYDPESIPF